MGTNSKHPTKCRARFTERLILDTGAISVVEWIAHDIPRVALSKASTTPLKLSEVVSPYSPQVAEFFRLRISAALGGHKADIVENSQTTSPIPQAAKDYIAGAKNLIDVSQVLALHLRNSQTAAMSAGLLVIARIEEGEDFGIAILKLEPQDGAQAKGQMINGKFTYGVSILTDLLLTKGTRVFKVAVFMMSDTDEKGVLNGRAVDSQNMTGTSDLARFWLHTYLGFNLTENAELMTRRFLDAGEIFLNTQVKDPELRAKYQIAMMAELVNHSPNISVKSFATINLNESHRLAFVEAMVDAKIPRQPFPKDIELVKKHLENLSFVFKDGTSVITSSESINSGIVKVTQGENESTDLHVREHLSKVSRR